MNTYLFTYETKIEASLEEVWSFFSTAENLVKITDFPTITLHSNPLTSEGNTIQMKIGVGPIKANWHSYIEEVKPLEYFIDVGVKVPFSIHSWRHKHAFVSLPNHTLMKDTVEIQSTLPSIILKTALKKMFTGREKAVQLHFLSEKKPE
ncbi:hypothetical protein AB3N04_03140 [Alkalihalophilus sp. As8PL]|uniref:SRPBCC family protein n=1 Tax=Alkalihalophilus sp. As8PL TaxID=3237103 RepID=A0AB39BTV8_9BACI